MTSRSNQQGGGHGGLFVAAVRIEIHLPEVRSLKDKRAVVQRVIAALRNDLDASVAEIGFQDVHQRAALGVVGAASTAAGADRFADRVRPIVERDPRLLVTAQVIEIDRLSDPD